MAIHNLLSIALLLFSIAAGVESVGICYGREGDNLPPANEVIDLIKANKIGGVRLYDTNHDALQALKGTNIPVIVDVPDSDLSNIASSQSSAAGWVQDNIKAFPDVSFRYIAVGNEDIPGPQSQNILPAMQNIQNALQSAGLGSIKASTSISTGVFGTSYPPSAGIFSSSAISTLGPIVSFLASNNAPLLVNIYPYFSYIENPSGVSLDYALFTSPGTVVDDGQWHYQNLFDAMVDAMYSALEKAGAGNVWLVVSETGWPSNGGGVATMQNAQTYATNLINHVRGGTPKKPGNGIETYLFSIFDENLKMPHGTENNYGLFHPDKQPKYSLNF